MRSSREDGDRRCVLFRSGRQELSEPYEKRWVASERFRRYRDVVGQGCRAAYDGGRLVGISIAETVGTGGGSGNSASRTRTGDRVWVGLMDQSPCMPARRASESWSVRRRPPTSPRSISTEAGLRARRNRSFLLWQRRCRGGRSRSLHEAQAGVMARSHVRTLLQAYGARSPRAGSPRRWMRTFLARRRTFGCRGVVLLSTRRACSRVRTMSWRIRAITACSVRNRARWRSRSRERCCE